jgi:hypothetical protein
MVNKMLGILLQCGKNYRTIPMSATVPIVVTDHIRLLVHQCSCGKYHTAVYVLKDGKWSTKNVTHEMLPSMYYPHEWLDASDGESLDR